MREFDVALSFAGEDRKYAEQLAKLLESGGYLAFYDKHERPILWGKDLYQHLSKIYKDQARYCVMFLSKHYAQKLWTRHELQSAQARTFEEDQEYVLPVRLDDTEIPGIPPTVAYLDLREVSIEEVYQALVEKLKGHTVRAAETNESDVIHSPGASISDLGSIEPPHQSSVVEEYLSTYNRHDNLPEITSPIIAQMEEKSETRLRSTESNLTVTICPALTHRPLISTSDIYEFMKKDSTIPFNDSAIEFGTRKVKGGVCFMGIPDASFYWELNEYGVIYHRFVLNRTSKGESFAFDTNEGIEEEYLSFKLFVRDLAKLIPVAQSFYEKSGYSDEIKFVAQMRQIYGEKLMYDDFQYPEEIHRQESIESSVSASAQCLPRELANAADFISVVDELTKQLIWVFNVNDRARRNKVETILRRCGLVPAPAQ